MGKAPPAQIIRLGALSHELSRRDILRFIHGPMSLHMFALACQTLTPMTDAPAEF